MTRKECLEQAMGCVLRDRNSTYGKPEDCFGMIARMWGAYLGVCVSAHDVAAMMALLKIARFRHNPSHEDNAVDCAGYAACMIETATAWEREQAEEQEPQDGDEVMVTWKHKDKAEGVEEPKFKAGDKVQIRVTLPSVSDRIWVDGEYVRYEKGRSRPHVVFTSATLELVSDEDVRPAPIAEGVEELVQHDAPQTPAELYDKIIASNPATYGSPHKPTGEELAEMAEEETHG